MYLLKKIIRRFSVLLLAVLSALLLVFSVTVANFFISGKIFKERKFVKTEVAVKKPEEIQKKQELKKPARKPNRQKSSARTPKAGPRMAMNLGVAGSGGAAINEALVADFRGGAYSNETGEVDKKPASRSMPQFEVPPQIRDAEIDAVLRLTFCVDANGRAYDIRIVEETPSGAGLGAAGKASLSRMSFEPAERDGKAVPFCGMEQPFEVKFHD